MCTFPSFLGMKFMGVTSDQTWKARAISRSATLFLILRGYLEILYVRSVLRHLLPVYSKKKQRQSIRQSIREERVTSEVRSRGSARIRGACR